MEAAASAVQYPTAVNNLLFCLGRFAMYLGVEVGPIARLLKAAINNTALKVAFLAEYKCL